MKIENLIANHNWSTKHILLKGKVYDTVEFLTNAIEAETVSPLADYYGVHYHTISRAIETQLPEIQKSGKLDNRVLAVLDCRRCPKCKGVQTLNAFRSYICEDCRKPKEFIPCPVDNHEDHLEEVPWCEPCMRKHKRWTRAEQDILKKHYNITPNLSEVLPGFTTKQIHNQVYYLKKCGWTFASKKP